MRGDAATHDPAVSIILPTYNRAYCLRRSIDSVLRQTFGDFELIVIDDGSKDDTKALVEGYDDPRLRYVHNHDNQGQTKRLNQGISLARAPLIAFQDSDDEWLPEKLEKQVTALRAAPPNVGVVYVDRWRIGDRGEKTLAQAVHIMPEDGFYYEAGLAAASPTWRRSAFWFGANASSGSAGSMKGCASSTTWSCCYVCRNPIFSFTSANRWSTIMSAATP